MKVIKRRRKPFWDWTEWRGACLYWTGAVNRGGYGKVTYNGKPWTAHRLAYSLYYLCDLSAGLDVMHLCHTRICCNPLHLRLGTRKENIQHSVADGRMPMGITHHRSAAKLDWELVRKIRSLRYSLSQTEIAKQFSVVPSNVSRIMGGQTWRE